MRFVFHTLIPTTLVLLATIGPASGQLIEPANEPYGTIAFERPFIDRGSPSAVSGAYTAYAVFPLQDETTIELMAPIVFLAEDGDQAFALGNPRIRFRSRALGELLEGDFAVSLPAATDDIGALSYGYRTVVAKDLERFSFEVTAFTAGLDGTMDFLDGRFALRPRVEASFWITASGNEEFFVRPSLGALVRLEHATLHAALRVNHWVTIGEVVDVGTLPLTLRDATFDEATIQDVLLEAEFDLGRVRPAVSLSFSLDDDVFGNSRQDWDTVLGLRVSVFRD